MTCPVHGGSNPTSFSFSEATFICHSCGVRGGLIALMVYLHECSRLEALRKLHFLAGLPFEEGCSTKDNVSKPLIRRRGPRRSQEYFETANKFEWLKLIQLGLYTALRVLRSNVKLEKTPLEAFYAKEQQYLYELEELDPIIIELKCKVSELKKKGIIHDDDTAAGN